MNALILFVFGSSAATLVNNPWVIAAGVILTLLGFYFIYRGIRKNGGKGGLQRNLTMTFLVITSFLLGYLAAAYQTHDYFKERTHHVEEECETCGIMDEGKSKEEVMLMENMNPLNNMNELSATLKKAIEINKESSDMKADMRAEMMKHATVTEEVMCECPYHEQLEKEKDSNINVK